VGRRARACVGVHGVTSLPAPSDPGGLTILRTVGGLLATKRWTWHDVTRCWVKKSYDNAAHFTVVEVTAMTGIDDLAKTLQQIAVDPHAMVIRGAMTDVTRAKIEANPEALVRRRKKTRGGVEPDFIEVPRQWLMVDIDNFQLRACDDLIDDPEGAIAYALSEILPECFQDVRCFWQVSSSAGFERGVLKAHIFYWLTEPLIDGVLKRTLKQHAPGITDLSVYQGVQPHYVATPVIEGGRDPIPRRFGWIEGMEDAVRLPPLKAEEPRQSGSGSTYVGGRVSLGGDPLVRLGDGEGLGGFNEPLRSACLDYARRVNRGDHRDDASFIDTVANAITAAPKRVHRDVSCYDDEYLKRSIAGAFERLIRPNDLGPVPPHPATATRQPRPLPNATTARGELRGRVKAFLARAMAWHRAKIAQDATAG
jgi:hypothetical protein